MQRALGRNMGTVLQAASNIGGSIRDYSERKRLEEEEGKGGINVPISQAFPRQAIGGESLGEAIDTRKREIKAEEEATSQTYEENKAKAEVEAGEKKIVIDNMPEVETMKRNTPTAWEMMHDMAKLSGLIGTVHGTEVIKAADLEKLRLQIGKNREWRRDFNVAALEDMSNRLNQLNQAITEDPKQAEQLAPEIGKLKAQITAQTNLVATEDEEVRKWRAKQKLATSKPDEWQAWGHGQMRNKRTGEIKKIPTKPISGSGKDVAKADIKRVSNIKNAMATLDKTDRVTMLMATLSPKLKGLVGQKIDPQLKAELFEQWNREISYLERPEGTIPEKYRSSEGDVLDLGL